MNNHRNKRYNNIHDIFIKEKLRLLEESLMLIERLRKMRSVGAEPRMVGIDPHILWASGLYMTNTEHIANIIKRIRMG